MPPKRKSTKRKPSTAAAPSSSAQPPAKKQRVGEPVTRTTRTTRSGTAVVGSVEDQTANQDAQPPPNCDALPVPGPSQVSAVPEVSSVPPVSQVSGPQAQESQDQKPEQQANPPVQAFETGNPGYSDATPQTHQTRQIVQPTQAPQPQAPQSQPLLPASTSTPPAPSSSRTPSRRPPIFSEAMKHEQAGLAAEGETNGNGTAASVGVKPFGLATSMHQASMEAQSLEGPPQITQQPSSNAPTTHLLSRHSSPAPLPATEQINYAKYANHPVPAIRNAHASLQQSETWQAEMQAQLDRDALIDASGIGRFERTRYDIARPSEALRRNLADDDAAVERASPSTDPVAHAPLAPNPVSAKPDIGDPPSAQSDAPAPATQQSKRQKREKLARQIRRHEAEIRALDSEMHQTNAVSRADACKQMLERHRTELEAGIRKESPYFPGWVPKGQQGVGRAEGGTQVQPLSREGMGQSGLPFRYGQQQSTFAPVSQPVATAPQASSAAQVKGYASQRKVPTPAARSKPLSKASLPAKTSQRPVASPAIDPQPDIKPSFSQNTSSALPANRKAAITEPARTGAISPYGHRMTDAPETSALLAELENLSRGTGTPGGATRPPYGYSAIYDSGAPAVGGAFNYPYGNGSQPVPSRPGPSTAASATQIPEKGNPRAPHAVKTMTRKPSTKQPKLAVEKRPAMFRKKCPIAVRERAERVREQRMYMVHRERHPDNLQETIHILGTTGNIYTVTFSNLPTCSCPDFQKGNHCKHIIFVALKVLRMPEGGDMWYQRGYLDAEIREIFAAAPPNSFNSVAAAPPSVRKAFREHVGLDPKSAEGEGKTETDLERDGDEKRRPVEGDECPICADEMTDGGAGADELVYDLGAGGCGKALHKQCFMMWAAQEKKKRKAPTCVYCRHEWTTAACGSGAGAGLDMSGGYLNMAGLAGISRQRDTSSYYQGPRKGKRYRGGCAYDYDDE